jgi:methionine-rich copper-binding protein CopC
MAAPYHQGDNVPVKFTVGYEGAGITPTYAHVHIQDPNMYITEMDDAAIDSSNVSFIVPQSATEVVGRYTVEFKLGLPYGERTHKSFFHIEKNLS